MIMLYRDPRGIANSRGKINNNWDIAEQIVQTCHRMVNNTKIGTTEPWMKNKIKFIRFYYINLFAFLNDHSFL